MSGIVTPSERVLRHPSTCTLLESVNNSACLPLSPWTLTTKCYDKHWKRNWEVDKTETWEQKGGRTEKKEKGIKYWACFNSAKICLKQRCPCVSEVTLNKQFPLGHMSHYWNQFFFWIVTIFPWKEGGQVLVSFHSSYTTQRKFPVEYQLNSFVIKGKNEVIGYAWQLSVSPFAPEVNSWKPNFFLPEAEKSLNDTILFSAKHQGHDISKILDWF